MAVRVTRRAPAPPRRPAGPLPWALAAGGAVLALAAFAWLVPPSVPPAAREEAVARRESDARRSELDGRLEEAAAALEALARDLAGDDLFRVRVQEWRAQARVLREEARARQAVEKEWLALQARATRATDVASLVACRQAAADLRRAVGRASFAWTPALAALEGELDRRIGDLKVAPGPAKRVEIEEGCALGRPGEARWGKALGMWADYLALALPAADREYAERQIQGVHLGARGEADRIAKRARALAEAGREDEGRALLEAERPRFAGTQAEALLR